MNLDMNEHTSNVFSILIIAVTLIIMFTRLASCLQQAHTEATQETLQSMQLEKKK